MNTHKLPPLVFITAMARRLIDAGCSFALSLGLIERAARDDIAFRNAAASELEAIDARFGLIRDKLMAALSHETPKVRREILAAIKRMHQDEIALAASLRVQLPLMLMEHTSQKPAHE